MFMNKCCKSNLSKHRKGLWQYLIDHSIVLQDGSLKIQFVVKDKKDFLRRLNARESGRYSRTDEKKIQNKVRKMKSDKYWRKQHADSMVALYKSGGWYVALLFKVKKYINNYLIKKAKEYGDKF